MNICRVRTPRGVRAVLTYWYKKRRYRPVLGHNLTVDQEREEALKLIAAIHAHHTRPSGEATQSPTFSEFIPVYMQYLRTKRVADLDRNETALRLHLMPHFGPKRLPEIRLADGLSYIDQRRQQKAADGTIERECAVLGALLNWAVECEVLDRNRLRRLPVPEYQKRERPAEAWELQKLRAAASPEVWRMITIALQTGLRETKIIESHRGWLVEGGGGLWLVPTPGRSRHKRVSKAIPLNGLAEEAFLGMGQRICGRFFERWKDANSFKHRWDTTCKRAGVHDLHFHDLRHTFATWLMQAGVDYVIVEKLLGHRLPGTGELYVHDWDGRLREAVTRLEAFTEAKLREETGVQVPLEVPPSYVEPSPSRISAGNVVPRDRIELSTPAFSGLCSAN